MEVQHNKDYVFVESPSHDVTCIGINEGKYAGVVLKYCLLYTSPSPRD